MISFEIDGIQYRMFDHLYAVSRCGKVLRKFTSYIPTKHPEGYLCLGRQRLMHRVVATCWLDNPTNASHVHHINEDKSDNRVDNLEWLTPKEHFGDRHKGLNGSYTRTDETRNKLRLYRTGRKDSEATRLRKAEVLATNGPKTQCSFQNIVYPSVAAAARVAGIHPTTFRQRCLSKNFSDYKLLIL